MDHESDHVDAAEARPVTEHDQQADSRQEVAGEGAQDVGDLGIEPLHLQQLLVLRQHHDPYDQKLMGKYLRQKNLLQLLLHYWLYL